MNEKYYYYDTMKLRVFVHVHTSIHCICTSGETKLTFNSVPNFTKELPAKEVNIGIKQASGPTQ